MCLKFLKYTNKVKAQLSNPQKHQVFIVETYIIAYMIKVNKCTIYTKIYNNVQIFIRSEDSMGQEKF